MQRPRVSCVLDTRVAFQAVDSLDHVGTVLEGAVLFFLLEPEHLGTSACGAGHQDQAEYSCNPSHCFPAHAC